MRRKWTVILALALLALSAGAYAAESAAPPATPAAAPAAAPAANPLFKTEMDKVSYAIGMDIGRAFKKQDLNINLDLFIMAIKDVVSGAKLQMTDAEFDATLRAFQQQMVEKQMAARKAAGEKTKKEGEEFLAANKKKPGVVTLPSGLQYKIITEGKGKKPTATDTVECNYTGTLIDGTVFDASSRHGDKPAEFTVGGGVIKGWTEALQLMPVGSKWQLFVPTELAYAERPPTPAIPPNSALIFELELVGIK